MRHFLDFFEALAPPLSIPLLPGGMAQAPFLAVLVAPGRFPLPLASGLLRTGPTAVALTTVAARTDGHLTATTCAEQQPVVRKRSNPPRLPGGELDGESNRGDTGRQNAAATPCFGRPKGGVTGKSTSPSWAFTLSGQQQDEPCSRKAHPLARGRDASPHLVWGPRDKGKMPAGPRACGKRPPSSPGPPSPPAGGLPGYGRLPPPTRPPGTLPHPLENAARFPQPCRPRRRLIERGQAKGGQERRLRRHTRWRSTAHNRQLPATSGRRQHPHRPNPMHGRSRRSSSRSAVVKPPSSSGSTAP